MLHVNMKWLVDIFGQIFCYFEMLEFRMPCFSIMYRPVERQQIKIAKASFSWIIVVLYTNFNLEQFMI